MGVMTGQTLPLPDRLVHYALFERSGLILVTPIAEVGSGLLDQSFETCHVWTVTRNTPALGNRLMHCFALEVSLLVALTTQRTTISNSDNLMSFDIIWPSLDDMDDSCLVQRGHG
jgi:uncharacterized membrane protein